MPRISGRSSLTTTSPIRFSPSVRSVSRWFFLRPMPTHLLDLEPCHQLTLTSARGP